MSFLPPGTRLGNYEVVRGIAVGGMAELYLARSAALDVFSRLVALKRILPHYASSDEFVAMFLDEARLTAKIQHPNIAQVYDIGLCEAGLFFTMEFVRGEDVRTLLCEAARRDAHVPLEHALAIVSGACAGLHAAHELRGRDGQSLGLVHRDVSPSNIIVSFDGNVKIIDFGVAKARGRQTKTRDGTIKGKISYMSPEQCRGEPLDRRSDVFALGILLWELTTTHRLFHGSNDFAVLKRIGYQDAPRPSSVIPGYPRDLEEIVMRALSRNLSRRYQTADALRRDIEAFASQASLPMRSGELAGYLKHRFPESVAIWQEVDSVAHDRHEARLVTLRLSLAKSEALAAIDAGGESGQGAPNGRNPSAPEVEVIADDQNGMGPGVLAPTVRLVTSSPIANRLDTELPRDSGTGSEMLLSDLRPRRRWPRAAAGGLVAAAAGLALWLYGAESRPVSPEVAPVAASPRAAGEAEGMSDMRPGGVELPGAAASAVPAAVPGMAAAQIAAESLEESAGKDASGDVGGDKDREAKHVSRASGHEETRKTSRRQRRAPTSRAERDGAAVSSTRGHRDRDLSWDPDSALPP